MYLGRHYPRWKDSTEGYWFSLSSERATEVPPFFYTITPAFEGQEDDEWYGMLRFTLHVVNPLHLRYPDTTNAGEANVDFTDNVDSDEEMMERLNLIGQQTTANPLLFMAYNSAIVTANQLFSTNPQFHCNYWSAAFSVYETFVEDETPAESLARIKTEHPVFESIEGSVIDGDMSRGLLRGTMQFDDEVPDAMPEPLTNANIEYVRRFRQFLRQESSAITEQMELVHFNCETGATHQCKYGEEETVTWRGAMKGEDIFEQFLSAVTEDQIPMSNTVLNNYKELALKYQGDCHPLMPMLTPDRDIILHWRPGPYQAHSVVIRADGTMFIQADRLPRSAASAHLDGFKEVKSSERFDVDVLNEFIEKGDLAS